MALRDYLKSHKTWAAKAKEATVATVASRCDTTVNLPTQQLSASQATVAEVATIASSREEKKLFSEFEITLKKVDQLKDESLANEDKYDYVDARMEIEDKTVSGTGSPSPATVATVATVQDSCWIAGESSCDTSATVATVEPKIDPDNESEDPILYLQRQIESAWRTRTPWIFDVPEGYEANTLCRHIEHQFDTWWKEEPGALLMGAMVLPAFPDQPERIRIYPLNCEENDSPLEIDDPTKTLQKIVLWAEHCQTGAEWPIPAEWCEKAEGLQRMADNVARATGRDRRILLNDKCLRCVPWGFDE